MEAKLIFLTKPVVFETAFQIHNTFLIFSLSNMHINLVKQTQEMKIKYIYFLFTLCYIKQPLYV